MVDNQQDRPAASFLELPAQFSDPLRSAAALIPVPYDEASTWMKGADAGPQALLEASSQLELFDIETWSEPYRKGITTLRPIVFRGPPTELAEVVAGRVDAVFRRRQVPVVLGGDHSVAIGAIQAAVRNFPELTVLQLDAHGDTRESYHGSSHNHACVMARVRQWCPIVQVGIRSLDASEIEVMDRERVFFAHEIAGNPDRSWMDRAVELTGDPVYVTVDLDVFDPLVVAATGTPEPGGLGWYDVTELLSRLTQHRRVVGFDVTELCPVPGHHASAFTAAKLVYRFLALIFSSRGIEQRAGAA